MIFTSIVAKSPFTDLLTLTHTCTVHTPSHCNDILNTQFDYEFYK